MKIGLVLEGGAMRGVFTAGVLDVFLDQKFQFDRCYAVSVGSCLACSYLCAQRGRGYAVMTDYLDNKDYCSFSSLRRTGDLFGAEFLYHKIPEELYPIDNEAFHRNGTEFYSVVTDCNRGNAEYLRVSDMFSDVDKVRASASLPFVSRMVEIDGQVYLDGGVTDPIPVQKALSDGCDKIVVVLTRPRDYRKKKERSSFFARLKYRKYPAFVQAMKERVSIYNRTLEALSRLEAEGKALVLAPAQALPIRRTEKDLRVLLEGYRSGCALAEESIPQINDFLAGKTEDS